MSRRKNVPLAVVLALALSPLPAVAQIYSYKDPATGSRKITNLRPEWYVKDAPKSIPRTQVIVRGAVVEDSNPAAAAAEARRRPVEAWRNEAALSSLRRQPVATPAPDTPAGSAEKPAFKNAEDD